MCLLFVLTVAQSAIDPRRNIRGCMAVARHQIAKTTTTTTTTKQQQQPQ